MQIPRSFKSFIYFINNQTDCQFFKHSNFIFIPFCRFISTIFFIILQNSRQCDGSCQKTQKYFKILQPCRRRKNKPKFFVSCCQKALTIFDFCVIIIKPTSFGSTIGDRKSTRLNSSHNNQSRMPSSA